jgi:5'-phosphate synthase pdxT subunit
VTVQQRERVPGEEFAPVRPQHRGPGGQLRLAAPGTVGREHAPVPQGAPIIGVLALQGDVLEHLRMLTAAGANAVGVKRAPELDGLDGLIIPGGESTTIGKLADMYGLLDPLRKRIAEGLPVFGTCAGAILLAREALSAEGERSEQPLLGAMDIVVRRNAFGRQVASFEADLAIAGLEGGPVHVAFIRAPWIEHAGPDVEVLAEVGTPLGARMVVARQGHLLASAFHPELTGDGRLHRLFVDLARRVRRAGSPDLQESD